MATKESIHLKINILFIKTTALKKQYSTDCTLCGIDEIIWTLWWLNKYSRNDKLFVHLKNASYVRTDTWMFLLTTVLMAGIQPDSQSYYYLLNNYLLLLLKNE